MTINLINNIAFLIALVAAGQVVVSRLPENTLNRQVLFGLLFGGVALLGMANPVSFAPGVFFDGRSIVLAVAGVAGGGVTAAIAAGMAAFYRYQLGGIGAPVGIMIVLLSALFGVLARQWWRRRTQPPRPIDYLALGVVVQLMQLAAFTQVPNRAGYAFIEQAWWVLLLFYPLATMLLCLMFRNVEQQLIDKAALQSARVALVAEQSARLQRFRAYFEHSSIGFAITSAEKGWLEVNDALCATLGYARDELTRLTWSELTCPADLPADQIQFDRMLASEIKSYDIDKRFIHKDGHLVETHLAASLVRKPDGSVDYVVAVVEDLSERKLAQANLAESEARFEGTFEQAAVGIALVAPDGRWLRVNDKLCSIVGSTHKELLAKTFQDITHPDDLDADLDQKRRMLAREIDTYALEKRYLHKGGGTVWVNLTVSLVRKTDGTPDYFISVVEDISARKAAEQSLVESQAAALTEQHQAQLAALNLMEDAVDARDKTEQASQALRESEERFRRAVTGAPFPIMIHAEDGQVVTINSPWIRLTGYEHSDIPTIADWTRKAYGTLMDPVLAYIDGLYALDGPKAEGEYTITTSSGGSRIWDFSSAPIGQMPDGRRLVISMAMDVTERKQTEENLAKMSRLMQNSQKIAHLGSFEYVAADQTTIWSEEEYRIYGLDPNGPSPEYEVMLGKCIHPDDAKLLHDTFMAAMQNQGVYELEHRIVRPDGSVRWVFDKAHPYFDEQGKLLRYVGATLDITARKHAREELENLNAQLELKVEQRTALLEASNKELEAFSYSVSHDLRAPLRHINGYVDLLNNRFREALPEKAGHYLNQVTDSASQMGTLIDDLLQFSRTGRQELRQADLDMNTVVQEALEKLKPDTKNRNISWTVAELPQVYGDYALLQQVWINLLDNAVKYTQYKDQATIEVGFTREPDQWEFFVRDNGVGFDMQYAHKLFGVFQRLHSPAQFEGTGIGLANVQRIVHKHGGRVRAEAQPEKGATFYFTLAAKPTAERGSS